MSSVKDKIVWNKKGFSAEEVVIVFVIGLILLIVVLNINVGSISKAGKVKCLSGGIVEGFCVAKESECGGIISTIFTCPKKTPFCCMEKTGSTGGTSKGTSTDSGQAAETPSLKGTMEFYCKCKVENGYLMPRESFNKMEIKDLKKGNTDFKAKKGIEYEMQVRGTDDVKYCRISIIGLNKAATGSCSKDSGVNLTYAFADAGDFDIDLFGYDKKGGTQAASAVVDMTIE